MKNEKGKEMKSEEKRERENGDQGMKRKGAFFTCSCE
jgi:hypothetical protein